jgi:hypothetical protein
VVPASFGLAGCFVGIAPECRASLGGKFRTAALDEIAGFGDDVLQRLGALSINADGEHIRIGNWSGVAVESAERVHHLESPDESR